MLEDFDAGNPAGSSGGPAYPSTLWSEVERARSADDQAAAEALDSLLKRYYRPLHSHLVAKFRATEEQAADWLQSFVWKKILLDKLIARADRSRGKFRTFLLNAVDNFVISERRKENAQTRMPAEGLASIEELSGQELSALNQEPDSSFDFDWAVEVLDETLRRMKAACSDCPERWAVFKLRLLDPILDQADCPPYQELLKQFDFESPSEASNVLITAKRMFQRCLREVVAEYVGDGPEIDLEIEALIAALGSRK